MVEAEAGPYQVQIVPACTRYVLLAGGEVCGYRDIEDWRTVARADAELVACRAQEEPERRRADLMAAQVADLRLAVEAERRAGEIQEADRSRLRADLIALDRKYQDERVKPRVGGGAAWAVSAGLAVGLAVATTIAVVR